MIEDRVTRVLRCSLDDDELRERGDQAGDLVQRINRLQMEKKGQAKSTQEVIDRKTAELSNVAEEIREKATHREVECEIHHDHEAAEVYVVRTDIGEEIDRRPMSEGERQRPLPLGEEDQDVPPVPEFGVSAPAEVDLDESLATNHGQLATEGSLPDLGSGLEEGSVVPGFESDSDLMTESEVEDLGVAPPSRDEVTP